MPFIPLSQRKPVPLVVDDEKVAMQQRQQAKDQAAINRHFGIAAGASGYRFANHPQTFGNVRGPDVPFRNAHASWRPPEADPEGPAKQRDREQASYGAFWDSSHSLKASRSSPTLQSTAVNLMEACHPITAELRRWEDMGRKSEAETRKDIELKVPLVEPHPAPVIGANRQGLVLFPKYMLLNNCHLKTTDLQRFQREQQAAALRTMERSMLRSPGQSTGTAEQDVPPSEPPSDLDLGEAMGETTRGQVQFEASWGAPLLREGGPQWAGSAMPSGGAHKTSNPFRMG